MLLGLSLNEAQAQLPMPSPLTPNLGVPYSNFGTIRPRPRAGPRPYPLRRPRHRRRAWNYGMGVVRPF